MSAEQIEQLLASESAIKLLAVVDELPLDDSMKLAALGIALIATAKQANRSKTDIVKALSDSWDEVTYGEVKL